MVDEPTELGRKMRELAEAGHPMTDDLLAKADAFDEAAHGFYAEVQTISAKQFLGCFARARKLWCECTGEPLI